MKKGIKYKFSIAAIFVVLLSALTGCWNARELNELPIVIGVGIDKTKGPNDILLTAQIARPDEMKKSTKNTSGSEGKAYWNLDNTSDNIFSAFREFTHETSNRLYLSHTQVIIFGKDAAKDGVQKYIDFFTRYHEIRPTIVILVSENTAGELFDTDPGTQRLPSMKISKLAESQGVQTAHALSINLQEFTASLISKTKSSICPLISIKEKLGIKTPHVDGMAVFKKDKLAGTLDPDETRGLLWVLGKVKSGNINIDLPEGKASIRILKSNSKVVTEVKNGKPYFRVEIKEEGILINQTNSLNLATLPGLAMLEQYQNKAIRNEILASIKKAKDLNTDFFGFGDRIHKKYSNEWNLMENNWDKIFPGIQVEIDVKSKIKAAGTIIKPPSPEAISKKE